MQSTNRDDVFTQTVCYTKDEFDDLVNQLSERIEQHRLPRASASPNRLDPSIIRPSKLTLQNRVLMTLMYLTRYHEYSVCNTLALVYDWMITVCMCRVLQTLGQMFGVSKATAFAEVHHTVRAMEEELKGEVAWPTDAQLQALCDMHVHMTEAFASVDATVHRIEKPKVNQRVKYSGYKKTHCVKTQFITAPNGYVLHVSTGWNGSMADK
jgi:hypothetical protein